MKKKIRHLVWDSRPSIRLPRQRDTTGSLIINQAYQGRPEKRREDRSAHAYVCRQPPPQTLATSSSGSAAPLPPLTLFSARPSSASPRRFVPLGELEDCDEDLTRRQDPLQDSNDVSVRKLAIVTKAERAK